MHVLEARMSFSSDVPLQANQLPISIDYPSLDDPKEFLDTLTLDRKRISDSMNSKEGALYDLNEQANFRKFYDPSDTQQTRNSYRSVFDLVMLNGASIGAGATVNFPHNIQNLFNTDQIYASCTTDEANARLFSVMGITVYLDQTSVYFTNPLGVALKQAIVVANYLKN